MVSNSGGIAFFLLLFFFFQSAYTEEKCSRVGSVCNKQCDSILVCTQVDQEPLLTVKCESPLPAEFCEESDNGATCTASSGECSAASVDVVCGSEGRFPHPTKLNAKVVCKESMQPPSEICKCPGNTHVSRDDLTVPCIDPSKEDPQPYKPTDCDGTFSGDLGKKFSYFCLASDKIIVSHKAGDKRKRRSLMSTRADDKCEPYSSGGSNTDPPTDTPTDDGNNNNPTEPTETSKPTEQPTEPTKPTDPPTDPTKPTDPQTDPTKPTDSPTDLTQPTEPNTPEIKCNKKGEYHADPTDCRRYYFCKEKSGEPLRRQCPANTYFYSKAKICLEGTC